MLARAMTNSKITLLTNKRILRWTGSNGLLDGVAVEDVTDGSCQQV